MGGLVDKVLRGKDERVRGDSDQTDLTGFLTKAGLGDQILPGAREA